MAAGETLGIVGESGSGKSVTASSLIRLLDEQARIVGGEVRFQGRDVVAMNQDELRTMRGNDIAMVFQDPMTSLNPVLRIARQMVETDGRTGASTKQQATKRAISLLGRMGITAPERAIDSYPHQFSGGMRQRVMLAMGFSNEPALLIADEPTTALDVTIQAQILDLIAELNRDFGAAIILISHALGVIASVCRASSSCMPARSSRKGRPNRCWPIRAIPTPGRSSMPCRASTGTCPGTQAAGHHRGRAARSAGDARRAAASRRAARSASPNATSIRTARSRARAQGALLGDAIGRAAAAGRRARAQPTRAVQRKPRRPTTPEPRGETRRCCPCAAL